MFHQEDGLYFGRHDNGSVRILKLVPGEDSPDINAEYPDAQLDVTIPAGHWASIVASVSARGEEGGRFYEAEKFHTEI